MYQLIHGKKLSKPKRDIPPTIIQTSPTIIPTIIPENEFPLNIIQNTTNENVIIASNNINNNNENIENVYADLLPPFEIDSIVSLPSELDDISRFLGVSLPNN